MTQPQWSPPPQQPMGWGGPGYAGAPVRPTGVTLAGIFLIIMGVLALLAGLLIILGGAALSSLFGGTQGGGVVAAIGAFLGIIVLLWAVLHLVGGIGSLQGKGWGRWTGIVVAVIAVILLVLGLLGSLGGGIDAGSLVFQIVFIVLYAGTAWALIQAATYFAYRR